MASCKCVACGKRLSTTQAYSMPKGSKNQYFCSEQEYKEYTQKKIFAVRDERRLFEVCEYILGHHTTNFTLRKYVKEWISEPYAVDVIDEHKDEVYDLLSRKYFDNEYVAIKYLQAVINNNLYDWTKEYKDCLEAAKPIKTNPDDMYLSKGFQKRKTKCLADFDI